MFLALIVIYCVVGLFLLWITDDYVQHSENKKIMLIIITWPAFFVMTILILFIICVSNLWDKVFPPKKDNKEKPQV